VPWTLNGLVGLYLRFGLIGRPEAVNRPAAFSWTLIEDPIAVAACRILNDFRPLDHILRSIFADTTDRDRKRYLAAALAQFCFRGGVRYEVLASISGREGWDEQFEPKHPMPLAYFDGSDRSYVVPLNATIASQALDRVAKDNRAELFDTFVSLGSAIASRVNRNAIRRRSPEARLAGRLFDYDQVVRGFLGDMSSRLYDAVQDLWQWNSRYWEQVALLNLAQYQAAPSTQDGKDALTRAIQHARHAVSIENHPLPLTTLGKILLAQLGPDKSVNEAAYSEAFGRLTEAIERERHWAHRNVHSFISLIRGTIEYFDRGGRLTQTQVNQLRRIASEATALFRRDARWQMQLLNYQSSCAKSMPFYSVDAPPFSSVSIPRMRRTLFSTRMLDTAATRGPPGGGSDVNERMQSKSCDSSVQVNAIAQFRLLSHRYQIIPLTPTARSAR